MLIEFRVENFLSIQDEQVLSMMASKDNTFFDSHTNGDKKLALLKSSVIYGANASGKSNIIKALAIMKKIVISSANGQRGDKLPIIPFLLGNEDNKSTKFEIIFIQNDTKYQYGFILNSEKILEEWLLVFGESNRAQKWFERIYNEKEEKYNYSFGAKFLGSKQLWENSTRDNALFLSVAIQLNNEQLKPVFDFFLKYIRVTCTDSWNDGQEVTIDILRQDKQKIISYLKRADLDIEDIVVEETELNKTNLMQENIPQEIKQMMQTDLEKGARLKKTDIKTIHTNQQGKQILFDMLELESQGTQKFFKLIGPWVEALEQGYTIVVDELNTHLHPLMTKFLVNLFHNEDLSKSNAQLIFTTHDTSILNQDVFRRDQIWFCEKQNKATKLYPLSDFKVRKDKTNLENDYLLGRFGALPYFKEILSSWSDNGN
ncbi:ATP-binding protein [Campylobacter coli]|uniref:AAA family ATPase n=3 Tax=Campylobacter coli TaxID=195 RepID=UPI000257EA91|nr:ATP-binding protein [Campylobacter coli]MCC3009995.1 ATP-binding protein [Campylobacter jejuni]EAH5016227.1 ATP-binding protein [Campylobacter coli]EAH5834562.1 ATP-binding protein [Campylobacter coli]EAH6799334.1 ATP-binding protein [Campylobacter coli]EAH6876537.1 ATP-binding protein [Campylobacter coli]